MRYSERKIRPLFTFYQLTFNATKSNVFITLSDASGRVIFLRTPGSILKKNVTRADYERLDANLYKRRKKSLREYTNTRKRTKEAAFHALHLFLNDVRKFFRLKTKGKVRFSVSIGLKGSNGWLLRKLSFSLLRRQLPFSVCAFRVIDQPPHNGCKLEIKKRKKNKGINKSVKRPKK